MSEYKEAIVSILQDIETNSRQPNTLNLSKYVYDKMEFIDGPPKPGESWGISDRHWGWRRRLLRRLSGLPGLGRLEPSILMERETDNERS